MSNLEKLSRILDQEAAQQASNQNYGGGGGQKESPYWILPYTWENQLGPHRDMKKNKDSPPGVNPEFLVRFIPHPEHLPEGVRLDTKHKLWNSPNDPSPRGFYCKECFHERDDEGELPEDGRCYWDDVLGVITPEIWKEISTMPAVEQGGPTGEEVAKMITELSMKRSILIPLLVVATKGITEPGAMGPPLYPSDNPDNVFGIVLSTRYKSSFHQTLLKCYAEDPEMGDWQKGRWLKLCREKAGQGYKSVLTPRVQSTALPANCLKILEDYPKLKAWGLNPPGQRSERKTLNVSYSEAEHFFKNTLWYSSLVKMTSDWIDWDDAGQDDWKKALDDIPL